MTRHSPARACYDLLSSMRFAVSLLTLAWWAIIGLMVTTFAFIGVNMFLSGLHSYGTL